MLDVEEVLATVEPRRPHSSFETQRNPEKIV
jgi:hypothetical protein